MGRGIDRAAVAASASLFVLLCAIDVAAGQETCTSVTVTGGGELGGDYELSSESSYAGQTEGHILQAIFYDGDDDSSRRALRQRDGEEGEGEGARRSLANDCTSQSWFLADTAAMVDGFPFYQAFDCAEHPADIDGETDWVLVTCDDCSEIVSVAIECAASADSGESQANGDDDGDDGDEMFTVGVIAGIAAAAGVVVLLLCVGLLCAARKKKKEKSENPKGNSTFADDSDHDARLKVAGAGAVAGQGAGVGAGAGAEFAAAGTASSTANADSDANANASTSASTTSRGMGFGRARSRSKVMGKGKGSSKSDIKTAAVAGAAGVAEAPGGSADASLSSTVESAKKPTRLFASGSNAKSFKPGHQGVESSSYEGMFASQGSGGGGAGGGGGGSSSGGGAPGVGTRHDSRAMSMDVDTRKDSMSVAAAAAAARALKARGGVEKASPPPLGSVLHSGVVADGRRAGPALGTAARTGAGTAARTGAGADAGGGITWSAGQDVYLPRRAGHGGAGGGHAAAAAFVAGEDSAAGSVYSASGGQQRYNRGDDDDDDDDDYYYDGDEGQPLQHTYNDECGESVPASSPGAYSMYSHYTAGGGAYRGGHSEAAWSSDGEEDGGAGAGSVGGRSRQHQRLRSAQAAMVIPAPNVPPTVVLEVTAGKGQSAAKMLSPAGHLARVDRNIVKRDDESGDFSRR